MDPITRVYAVISILVLGTMGAIGYNYKQDALTLEVAHDAEQIAKTARPNPYTSIMAERDFGRHLREHSAEEANRLELMQAKLDLISTRAELQIKTMPIPPQDVKDRLSALEASTRELSVIFARMQVTLAQMLEVRDYPHAHSEGAGQGD